MRESLATYLFIQRELVNALDILLTASEPPDRAVIECLMKLYNRHKLLLQKDSKRLFFKLKLKEIPLIMFYDEWFDFENFEDAKAEWQGVKMYGMVDSDKRILATLLKSDDNVPQEIRNEAFRLQDYINFTENDKQVAIKYFGHTGTKEPFFDKQIFFIAGKSLPFQSVKSFSYKLFKMLYDAKSQFVKVRDVQNSLKIKDASSVRNRIAAIRKLIRDHRLDLTLQIKSSSKGEYQLIIS